MGAMDSLDAMRLLEVIPQAVIATDQKNIIWINRQAEVLIGLNAQALNGKPIQVLPEWLSSIFENGDEKSQLTGESGCELVASLRHIDAGQLTMACFLSDSSEIKKLRALVLEMEERLGLLVIRDDRSGLLNSLGLKQVIETQVSRSRRYGNALSLISMKIIDYSQADNIKAVLEGLGHLFKDRLRWVDYVGLVKEDEFIFVLPETDKRSAIKLVEKLKNELSSLRIRATKGSAPMSTSFGVSSWSEGDDPSRLLIRCQQDRQSPVAGLS